MRIKKLAIIDKFTKGEWNQKLLATEGMCFACNRLVGVDRLTLDHIYPINQAYYDFLKSGIKREYKIDDVQPLCRSCNSTKFNKLKEVTA